MEALTLRIIVTGGGTGGHLFPGIALAEAMRRRLPGSRVLFIGTERQLDQQTLKDHDFELDFIRCKGLKGMGTIRRLSNVMQLPRAIFEAYNIVRRFRPDLVFGVGGYVTGPVLSAGRLCRVPVCIHEQNSVPGLANRVLSRIAQRIFLSIPCRYSFPEKKTMLTGNPVRREIITASSDRRQGKPSALTLLVLGGSQGAHRVNMLVLEAVGLFEKRLQEGLSVIHQTGKADLNEVRHGYEQMGVQAMVGDFFQDMAALYSRADLVVSRAGATTLAELSVMGLPALLIPYPFAADDHQKTNAGYYQSGGGARMLMEDQLSGDKLAREILSLLQDPDTLNTMAAGMKKMGRPEATNRIVDECLNLIGVGYDNGCPDC